MMFSRFASFTGRKLVQFWRSPIGPKTTHFWGPVANWGFVVAGLNDMRKDPSIISQPMTGALCVYSALFMKWSLSVRPKNYLLFACHVSNEAVQTTQLVRSILYQREQKRLLAAKAAIALPEPSSE